MEIAKTVVLFTGHLLDGIDRQSARFPYRLIGEVQELIQTELDKCMEHGVPELAVSSLAAGGDMIFASEILRRNIPLMIFLPFEQEKFLASSVLYPKHDLAEDARELETSFYDILSQSVTVIVTGSVENPDEAYAACNRAILSYALQKTGDHPEKILALALLKNASEIKVGGAADFVHLIESAGVSITKIWPHRSNKLYR